MINIKSYATSKPGGRTVTSTVRPNGSTGATTQLQTHYFWGNSYDGTNDVDGEIKTQLITVKDTLKVNKIKADGLSVFKDNVEINGALNVLNSIKSNSLETVNANVTGQLNANYADINDLDADTGRITTLSGNSLTFSQAEIDAISNRVLQSKDITTEYLTVTKQAHFFELIIDKIKAAGGAVILSPADGFKVDEVRDIGSAWTLMWRQKDTGSDNARMNMWEVGDQAICQTFNSGNLVEGTSNFNVTSKYYWSVVTSKGSFQEGDNYWNYINISKTNKDGNSVPEVGDEVAMLGSRNTDDPNRGNAVYLAAYASLDPDLKAPLICQYRGINDFNLKGHKVTWFAANGNTIQGDTIIQGGTNINDIIDSKIGDIEMPYVGENGNWIIDGVDSGIEADSDKPIYRLHCINDKTNITPNANGTVRLDVDALYRVTKCHKGKVTHVVPNGFQNLWYSGTYGNPGNKVNFPAAQNPNYDSKVKLKFGMPDAVAIGDTRFCYAIQYTTSDSTPVLRFKTGYTYNPTNPGATLVPNRLEAILYHIEDDMSEKSIDSDMRPFNMNAKAVLSVTDRIQANVTSVSNDLTSAVTRIGNLELTDQNFTTTINEIKSDITGLDSDLSTLNGNVITNTQNISKIDQKADNINLSVQSVTNKVNTNTGNITNLNTSLADLSITVGGISTTVSNQQSTINAANGQIESIKTNLSQVTQTANGLQSTVTEYINGEDERTESIIAQTAQQVILKVGDTYIKVGDQITLNGDTIINGLLTLNSEQGFVLPGYNSNLYITGDSIGHYSDWIQGTEGQELVTLSVNTEIEAWDTRPDAAFYAYFFAPAYFNLGEYAAGTTLSLVGYNIHFGSAPGLTDYDSQIFRWYNGAIDNYTGTFAFYEYLNSTSEPGVTKTSSLFGGEEAVNTVYPILTYTTKKDPVGNTGVNKNNTNILFTGQFTAPNLVNKKVYCSFQITVAVPGTGFSRIGCDGQKYAYTNGSRFWMNREAVHYQLGSAANEVMTPKLRGWSHKWDAMPSGCGVLQNRDGIIQPLERGVRECHIGTYSTDPKKTWLMGEYDDVVCIEGAAYARKGKILLPPTYVGTGPSGYSNTGRIVTIINWTGATQELGVQNGNQTGETIDGISGDGYINFKGEQSTLWKANRDIGAWQSKTFICMTTGTWMEI